MSPDWYFYKFKSIHLPSQMHIQLKGIIAYTPDEKITLKVKK